MAETKDAREEDTFVPETDALRCRFYENQYPEPEEVVMANVTSIGEMGAYVTLLEYDNIEGMILLSELSRRRIRSINKLVRVNKVEVVMVIRVDKEKGYIDLSKRRVDPEDAAKCEERFNKAKAVHSVLRHVAAQHGMRVEHLYQTIGWPLYKKYGHAYDAFKLAMLDEGAEDIFEGFEIAPDVKSDLLTYVKRKLAPQSVKIRADVEVTCFTYDGIDVIKEALLAGERKGNAENVIKIRLIAPPMYVITCVTLDKDFGIELMNQAIETISTTLKSLGGSLDVKMAPKSVTQREDADLQAMLDRLTVAQDDVDGDEPDDS